MDSGKTFEGKILELSREVTEILHQQTNRNKRQRDFYKNPQFVTLFFSCYKINEVQKLFVCLLFPLCR